jgi:hypothetical protein
MRRLRQHRGGTPDFLIPARLLAELLEPAIDKLDKEIDDLTEVGGRTALSARAASILGDVGEEAVYRRLYSIRRHECRGVHTEIADALLMAADINIADTTLPTLPGTTAGAREMVAVWAPEIEGDEADELALSMLHLATGFLKGLTTDLDDLVPAEDYEHELVAA